jgi:lipid-A-disaccharide synthase-like uncharacterized protein
MPQLLKYFTWDLWVFFGFAAQAAFMMRFVIQWWASEKRKRSYVPVVFWYLSLTGGVMLAIYAAHRRDPVFFAGQSLGCLIYIRNLWLIYQRQRRLRRRRAHAGLKTLLDDGLEESAENGPNAEPRTNRAAGATEIAPSRSDAAAHV